MILHPTDFSSSSDLAFVHALRLATQERGALCLLHVEATEQQAPPWHEYPSVRETLQRWGYLPPGAHRSEVAEKLGLWINKLIRYDHDVTDAIVDYVRDHDVEMVVLSTGDNGVLPRWLRPSIAESVALRARVPTLFVPYGCRGCVSPEDGSVSLNNLLIPVDRKPRADAAIEQAIEALRAFGSEVSALTLLHVGEERHFPWPCWPGDFPWKYTRETRPGRPVDAILAKAEELDADLIVLVTEGAHGFLDALRGSTTQQIVRHAPCPVLAIPHDG